MKSTITEKESPKKGYPRLMKSNDGFIVLFVSATKGIWLNNTQTNGIGSCLYEWHIDGFTDFDGAITLEND